MTGCGKPVKKRKEVGNLYFVYKFSRLGFSRKKERYFSTLSSIKHSPLGKLPLMGLRVCFPEKSKPENLVGFTKFPRLTTSEVLVMSFIFLQ